MTRKEFIQQAVLRRIFSDYEVDIPRDNHEKREQVRVMNALWRHCEDVIKAAGNLYNQIEEEDEAS